MADQPIYTQTDELMFLAETLGDVKSRTEKLESEFSTQAKPLEAATNALGAALAGIKSLQFHVVDNNLGALSVRVEEQRRAIDEQISALVAELKRADEANATATGDAAAKLREELSALNSAVEKLGAQFTQQLERVQLAAREEVKQLAAIPGPRGNDGTSLRGVGAYQPDRVYGAGEIVSYVGGSYLSNVGDNKERPGTKAKNWTQLTRSAGGGVGDIAGLTGRVTPSQLVAASTYSVGDILYASTTGLLSKLAAGTDGQHLITKGAGAAPQWSTTTTTGVAANDAETLDGTDSSKYVTPAGLANVYKPAINPRAPRQGLVFDGTAGATVSNVPAFGTGDFTVAAWITQMAATTSYAINSSTDLDATLVVMSTGQIKWASGGSDKAATAAGVLSVNKTAFVAVTRTGGTTTIYINGVSAATGNDTANCATAITKLGTAGAYLSGDIFPLIYNRALSQAEVLALWEQGAPSAGGYNNASNTTSLLTSAQSTFSGGGWTNWIGSVSVGSGVGAFTGSVGITGVGNYGAAYPTDLTLSPGRKYRLVADVTAISGGNVVLAGSNGAAFATFATGTGTAVALEFTAPAGVNVLGFGSSASGGTFTLDNVYLYALGLLLAPSTNAPGNGYQWHDESGNTSHILLPATGVSWALPSSGVNKLRGATVHSGSGNVQLLGAACIPIGHQITAVRAKASAGTPTIYIGNASGDNSYVQAVTLSTSWKPLTVVAATSIATTSAIWVNSNGAATISLDINHEPISA